jgi:competence protein ComEA
MPTIPKCTPDKYCTIVVIILTVIITVGGIIACSRYPANQPIEICPPTSDELSGTIYIDGAVSCPGLYPLHDDDSIEDIIQAAGCTSGQADPTRIELYIPAFGEEQQPQKIDLNRAETWLFEALPGIGKITAQAIVDYRNENGKFRSTYELTKVDGIGTATYEQIKHLITVTD